MSEDIRIELDCETDVFHYHDEMEIVYVLSGRASVMQKDANYVLRPEHFVVFDPFEDHGLFREQGCHTLSFYISQSILREVSMKHISCCSELMPELDEYLDLIRVKLAQLFEAVQYGKRNRPYVLSQIYSLLAILMQEFSSDESDTDCDAHVIQALRYIGSHLTQDISLDKVADEIHLSKSHLSRIFQKQTGVQFAKYVNALRVNMAATLLRNTGKSVLDIALESGFSNPNTLTANFKAFYGITPSEYRNKSETVFQGSRGNRLSGELSYMPLLKYASGEESRLALTKRKKEELRFSANIHEDIGRFRSSSIEIISGGRAVELLTEDLRETVRRTKRDSDYKYLYFHGILDDALDVYHEYDDGSFRLNYTYIDMVLDFLVGEEILPFIEFGFTPQKLAEPDADFRQLFGASIVTLPADLARWQQIIETMMKHFMNRYGVEALRKWRFCPTPAMFSHYGVFTMDEYLPYYLAVFNGIRNVIPEAYISGCALDTGYLSLDGMGSLEKFLEYCIINDCMPDALSFQCLHTDYSASPRETTMQKILARPEDHAGEPAKTDSDPDILHKELDSVRLIANKYCGAQAPEIMVSCWNSTLWHDDLGNDTCFKSAFIFKNYIECTDIADALVYCHMTDTAENMLSGPGIFNGGTGLVTFRAVPKAAYYAYNLLRYMEGTIVSRRDGCLITRSDDGKRISIGLYHYCHIDEDRHISEYIPEEEQRTIDRYYGYKDRGVKSCQIHLSGLIPGTYWKETYTVNRRTGSSFDIWMSMGSPEVLRQPQLDYLIEASRPGYHFSKEKVEKGKDLLITEVLDAHEVKVIILEKQ